MEQWKERNLRRALCLTGLALVGLLVPAGASGSPSSVALPLGDPPSAILVGFVPGTPPSAAASVLAAVGLPAGERLSPLSEDVRVVPLPTGLAAATAIARLSGNPAVWYAEPDSEVTPLAAVPNDKYYVEGKLWGMGSGFGSNAVAAWAADRVGSSTVAVGVVDTGVMVAHPDLAANRWINVSEIAGNRKDDDLNLLKDDVYGWDFQNNDASVFDGSPDRHGTFVAGIIGASAYTGASPSEVSGTVGVNWNVQIVPAKFLPQGAISNAVRAIDYLTALKTRATNPVNIVAINASWGTSYSETLLASLLRAGNAGILVVASAGNDGADNDAMPVYPSSYRCITVGGWDCVLAVTGIDKDGAIPADVYQDVPFSMNTGLSSVDIGAPADEIWSTFPLCTTSTTCSAGWIESPSPGTSFAAPFVTGAAALCASINPSITGGEIRNAILASAAVTGPLAGATVTGGRLDIGAMVPLCESPPPSVRIGVTSGPGGVVTWPTGVGQACDSADAPFCREVVPGASVELAATPDAGNLFVGWSGACVGTGSCFVEAFGRGGGALDRSVTATFEPIGGSWMLNYDEDGYVFGGATASRGTVTFSPSSYLASGTASCQGDCMRTAYVSTTPLTLTAQPATGSAFAGWTAGPCAGSSSPTCSIASPAADASVDVTASFVPLVTLAYTEYGQGTVHFSASPTWPTAWCTATCTKSFPQGTVVTMTGEPDTGYLPLVWSQSCSGASCTISMDANKTVAATFPQIVMRTLTVKRSLARGITATITSNPAGISCGSICSYSQFVNGTVVTLSVTTNGTKFSWSGCDVGSGGTTSTCVVTLTASKSVTLKLS